MVGERSGTAAISDREFSGQNEVGTDESKKQFVMKYVDLEEVVEAGMIGLPKCDIEGSELRFLRNYPQLLQRTDVAVVELHPDKCDANECVALLTAAGLARSSVLIQNPLVRLMHFWR